MATYTTTSKYVQITPYLVLEYMYADQPDPESYNVNTGSTTVKYNKLINGIIKGPGGTAANLVQIYNQDGNYDTTHNTSFNNVVAVSEGTFIPLNSNYIIPYNDFNSNLTSTANLPVTFSSNFSITYDTVRYHILAGYNLGNIDGLILGIDFLDVNGSYVTVSQIFLDSGFSSQYTLNPDPLTIGINSFDKYFEIKVPSLLYLNNQYISSPSPSLTPASLLSQSGRGFVVGSPMRIKSYEVLNTTLTSGYTTFGANLISTLSLESEDPFSNIGARIAPADTGDFFEFFATDNEGFIEDFILFQNSIGNQYYIQNSIEVLEQIGTALIQTSNFYTIQTSSYDIPNLYRPIIRNAGVASSFTLRYTMTLVNSADQSRVTRIASYTSNNPAKYGSFIAPLQLQNLPQVQKIYNKVATETSITVPNANPTPRIILKYSNVFFERNLVNTTMTNLVVKGTTITGADGGTTQDQTSYGQGKAYVRISPFDNYYKFTFYKQISNGGTQLIDLESSGTYFMVFLNNSNKKVSAPSIDDKNLANPSKGELAFKVSETLATDILQYTDRKFYITNRPPNSTDPNPADSQIPQTGNLKTALATRTTSLGDSSRDIINASKQTVQNLGSNVLTVSANSSSVLYWGNWIKDGESIPVPATGPTAAPRPVVRTRIPSNQFQATTTPVKSAWQSANPPVSVSAVVQGGSSQVSVSNVIIPGAVQGGTQQVALASAISPGTLTPQQLKTAISSDVQGKISLGWNTQDIISYFLDPTQIGNKLYAGITKKIFTDAVTGIFNDASLTILNSYGNTRGGRTDGGPAAKKGTTINQAGQDSGTSFSV